MRSLRRQLLVAGLMALATAGGAIAQQYPSRPVKLVVGFAPGGATDVSARLVAQELERQMGQPVVVENRPGAAGTIAANQVAKAPADGYTFLFGSLTIISPTLVKNGAVLGGKDLVPVAGVSVSPWMLFVRDSLPVKNMAELVAYAKANPGKLNFGAASPINQLAAEVLKARTGISFVNVPYKGSGPVAVGLMGGEVDFTLDSIPAYMQNMQPGKIRALFVSPDRTNLVAGDTIPSVREVGLPTFTSAFTLGLWAPPGLPKAIADRIHAEMAVALQKPDVVQRFRNSGTNPRAVSADELGRIYEGEMGFWKEAAEISKFEPQ